MGCGSSKGAAASGVKLKENEANKIQEKISNKPVVQQRPPSASSVKKQQVPGEIAPKRRPESGAVSVSGVGMRTASATSTKSNDSGIGHEQSDLVLKQNQESELKLKLSGDIPFERQNEKTVVEALRAEGLLNESSTKTERGGYTFEVPLNDIKLPLRRPPPRLKKLERNNEINFSQEQIREKLAKAEKKRKIRENEKIQRSRERDTKNLEVKLALLEFEKKKENELRKNVDGKIETHVEKREKRLENIVEKQKMEAKKVDEAKNRKFENSMNMPQEEYEIFKAKSLLAANLDDIPVGSSTSL